MNEKGIIAFYKHSFEANKELPLFSDYEGISYTVITSYSIHYTKLYEVLKT